MVCRCHLLCESGGEEGDYVAWQGRGYGRLEPPNGKISARHVFHEYGGISVCVESISLLLALLHPANAAYFFGWSPS